MPKQYEASSCGFDFKINGPSTVEEFDAKAGPGECLDSGIKSVLWRSTLPKFHRAFTAKLEELSGVKRAVDEKATAAAKAAAKDPENASDVMEKFSAFAKRARGTYLEGKTGDDLKVAEAELNAAAQAVADTLEIDPSASQRESGASKAARDKADSILLEDDEVIETKVAKISAVVPEVVIDRDAESGKPTRDSLAKAIDAWMAASL